MHCAFVVGPHRLIALAAQALPSTGIAEAIGGGLLGHGNGCPLKFQYRVVRREVHLHWLTAITDKRGVEIPRLQDLPGRLGAGRTTGSHRTQQAGQKMSPGRSHGLPLFVTQGMDGIGAGHPAGMHEHRRPGDQKGRRTRADEIERAKRNAIGKTLQPVMHNPPCDR